jgi:hypothetical protein
MRLAILFAVSLSLLLVRQGDNLDTIKLNGMDCGLEGTAKTKAGKALNRLKNRYAIPEEDSIDLDVSLPAMLAPGNDIDRFNAKKAATIRGYVVRVMVGGNKETCNCRATKPDERDTHIELALAKDAPGTQRVIVEVTPRLRMLKGADWTTKALKKTFEGKWVEVTGWLMFDTMHIDGAENTNPGNESNWRATCWEIHPVTAIKTLDEAPAAAPTFQPKSFAALQQLHSSHVVGHAKGKAAIQKRNKSYLEKFDKEELEEAIEEATDRRPR